MDQKTLDAIYGVLLYAAGAFKAWAADTATKLDDSVAGVLEFALRTELVKQWLGQTLAERTAPLPTTLAEVPEGVRAEFATAGISDDVLLAFLLRALPFVRTLIDWLIPDGDPT